MTPVWRDESTTSSNGCTVLTDGSSYFFRLGMFGRLNWCGHDWSLFSTLKREKINQSATQESPKHQPDPEGTARGKIITAWQPFLSLPSLLIVLSFFFSVRRACQCGPQCIGGRMPARTKWADKRPAIRAHTGDSLWWRLHSSTPSETPDMVAPNVFTLTAALSTIGTQKTAPHLTQTGNHLVSNKTKTFLHLYDTMSDLWLTQTLKVTIMQLDASLRCAALVSTVTVLAVEVISARHKEREAAEEWRWGIMSSCLKWL